MAKKGITWDDDFAIGVGYWCQKCCGGPAGYFLIMFVLLINYEVVVQFISMFVFIVKPNFCS